MTSISLRGIDKGSSLIAETIATKTRLKFIRIQNTDFWEYPLSFKVAIINSAI